MTDDFGGVGVEPTNVVTDASALEIDLGLPVTDAHYLVHSSMLLSEILKFVTIQIVSDPGGGQHVDVSTIEFFASPTTLGMLVENLCDQIKNLLT